MHPLIQQLDLQAHPDDGFYREVYRSTQQVNSPANHWQAAETTSEYSLMGCTVAPGFDFEDFSFLADSPEVIGDVTIKAWLENEPDQTLNDLCDKYAEHFNIVMGKSSMDRALKRMKISYKKSPYDPKKYSNRVEKLRIKYTEIIEDIDRDQLFFIDEMGANLNHSPGYGRSPTNERVYDDCPVAKGDVFLYFLRYFLCPLLADGDYVVMDNASVHKVADIKQLIEGTGAKIIYLPPYSPELNPIELAWNKMKTYIRKQRARTVDALYGVYADALESITLEDSEKFIVHAFKFLN